MSKLNTSRSLAFAGLLVFVLLLLSCACESDKGGSGITPTPPPTPQPQDETEVIEPVNVSFNHPCAYVNADDIARAKAAVTAANASDPVYASWLSLTANKYAQDGWSATPVEIVVRGDAKNTGVDKENYITADRDAAAAFQLALRWKISGDDRYANAAVKILNAWASVCKKITANDSNQYLFAGFQGHTFANAAELLRDYSGWQVADQNAFKAWIKEVFYQKNYWFLNTHGGESNCDLHYWSNWELANMASAMAIGIYLEDKEIISFVNHQFFKGKGSGALHNMVPFAPVPDLDGKTGLIAQSMESGRDQGHATLVISVCAELCRMAQNIGLDFWGADNNLVLAMCEYTAKYNVKQGGAYICSGMPFTQYKYCTGCTCSNQNHGSIHSEVSSASRGTLRPCWDLIYTHYIKEKGLAADKAYYTGLFADQLRSVDGKLVGDGGAGDSRYGSTSGAFDQLGWGTLLFYRQ